MNQQIEDRPIHQNDQEPIAKLVEWTSKKARGTVRATLVSASLRQYIPPLCRLSVHVTRLKTEREFRLTMSSVVCTWVAFRSHIVYRKLTMLLYTWPFRVASLTKAQSIVQGTLSPGNGEVGMYHVNLIKTAHKHITDLKGFSEIKIKT